MEGRGTRTEESWVMEIESQVEMHQSLLEEEREARKQHSIYKLPEAFTRDERRKRAYKPQVVSFGPYHHNGSNDLKAMEEHKLRALRHFLVSSGKSICDYLYALRGEKVVKQLMGAYKDLDGNWEEDEERFLRLMILDGCFLREVLRAGEGGRTREGERGRTRAGEGGRTGEGEGGRTRAGEGGRTGEGERGRTGAGEGGRRTGEGEGGRTREGERGRTGAGEGGRTGEGEVGTTRAGEGRRATLEVPGYGENDPIFSHHGVLTNMPRIKRDMLMLENQIPLLVLKKLLAVERRTDGQQQVTEVRDRCQKMNF